MPGEFLLQLKVLCVCVTDFSGSHIWCKQLVLMNLLPPTGGSTLGRQGSSVSQHTTNSVSVPPVAVAQSSEDTHPPSITISGLEKKPEVISSWVMHFRNTNCNIV